MAPSPHGGPPPKEHSLDVGEFCHQLIRENQITNSKVFFQRRFNATVVINPNLWECSSLSLGRGHRLRVILFNSFFGLCAPIMENSIFLGRWNCRETFVTYSYWKA